MNSLLIVRKCGQPCSTSPSTEQPADGPIGTYCQTIFADLRLNFVTKLRTRLYSHQPLDFSLKKRPDPSTYLHLPALICLPNRLRRTPGQMPPLPSPNQPRRLRPLRKRQILQCSLHQLRLGRNPSLHPSSICAPPSPNLFCPRTPSLYPNLCLRSLLKPPNSHRVSRQQQIVQAHPRITSRTYPQPTRHRSTCLRADKILTWMLFAASTSREPSLSPTSSTSAYWTTEPNHSMGAHHASLLSA